jgi:hypothetical protein
MGRYTIELAGEANYQAAITSLSPGDPVTITHEPDNPHDPRALRCADLTGATIGYIPRDSWLTGAMLDQKTAVRAQIHAVVGGERGKPSRGVVLAVLTAADARAGQPAPQKRAPAQKQPSWKPLKIALIAAAVVVGLILTGTLPEPESASRTASSSPPAPDPDAIAEQEKRKAGFHCLSAWDGSHRELVNTLKDNLRDPDSFEHIETRITPVSDKGTHVLMMRYRARNGFGGMNVGALVATVNNSDCSFEVVSTGDG